MRLAIKILGLALVLAGLFMAGFALWGGRFESLFNQGACAAWFAEIRPVAWLAAIGLLVADLLLPIPATGVMAALGAVYGVALGAAIGALGSTLAGLAGYGLARLAGRRGVRWIATEAEMDRFRDGFDRWGGYGILISRMTPVLPEVLTILAGLARMRFDRFLTALVLGSLATSLLYAWIGQLVVERPVYGMGIAVVVPLLIWPLVAARLGKGRGGRDRAGPAREEDLTRPASR